MADARQGKVYLVGAGPGDPKLLTLRGLQALQRADAVVYDRLASPLLLEWTKEGAELIYVGKRPDYHAMTQEEINRLLVRLAQEGKVVTRLKGGDPSVFGRVGEEAEVLAEHGIPYEIVPGITSAIAVPAYAGIPVTHREYNSSFAVITGHEDPAKRESSINWEKLALASETLIFLMGVGNLPYIVSQLIKYGRSPQTPVALIRWGTRVEQQTLVGELENIVQKVEEARFGSPAIILVGEVVRLRDRLMWYEKKPLFGQRVLVTRARAQQSELAERIDELGGEAVQFPLIRTVMPRDPAPVQQALSRLNQYDWVFFTSVNGVKYFFEHLRQAGRDIRELAGAQIAAVGPKTAAALEERGLQVRLLPEKFQAEGLLEAVKPHLKAGMKALLPRSDIAREVLPRELENMGISVTAVDVYDTVIDGSRKEEVVRLLREGAIHLITFTSSSTVRHFVQCLEGEDLEQLLKQVQVVSIGPITSDTCRELGIRVDAEAARSTIDHLVEAMCELVQKQKRGYRG